MSEEGKRIDMVGQLDNSLYGTRVAAGHFQTEVRKFAGGTQVEEFSTCR